MPLLFVGIFVSGASAQETREMSIDYTPPEAIGMVMSVAGTRLKGVDKTGDCDLAFEQAQGSVRTAETLLVVPLEDGKISDVATCEINKKGVASVKYPVVMISHKPTARIQQLSYARAMELVEAVRKAPSVGSSDLRSYSFSFTERSGKLYFDARSTNESQTYPFGSKVEAVAARSFYDSAMVNFGAVAAMRTIAAAVPEIDGFLWYHTFSVAKPPSEGGHSDVRVGFVFERDDLVDSPRAVLQGAEAFLPPKSVTAEYKGAPDQPLTLDVALIPERLP